MTLLGVKMMHDAWTNTLSPSSPSHTPWESETAEIHWFWPILILLKQELHSVGSEFGFYAAKVKCLSVSLITF